MPRRVHDFRGLTHVSRLRLLHAVECGPGRLLAQLAQEAGLHPNTVREHLAVLEREGLIRTETTPPGRRGRPPTRFYPVDDVDDNVAARDRAVAAQDRGDALRRVDPDRDRSAEDGMQATHQLDVLYDHLDDAGLEPAMDEAQLTVELSPCRYLGMMQEDFPLVCAVHLHLAQHQLAHVAGPVEVRRVEPFVTPTTCRMALGIVGEETRAPRPSAERRANGQTTTSRPRGC